jgi:signal transduction histidine kinase
MGGVSVSRPLHLRNPFEQKAKRLARDLHAESDLLLASLHLKLAEIELAARGRIRVPFVELRALIEEAASHLRRLAHELRPTILDGLGLIPACESLAAGACARHHVQVVVSGSTDGRLDPEIELAFYRVVQEAVTNATRHGQARRIDIEFRHRRRVLSARIADDGCGFDTAEGRRPTAGLGLAAMRQRVADLGGRMRVRSAPGRGTTLTCAVPVA